MRKAVGCLGLAIGAPIALWCIIIVAMLTFWYPREIRRVPGPDGMEAVLKYGPSLHPFFIPLLPIIGTHNNCHVFVTVEKDGQEFGYLRVVYGADMPEDHDDSEIMWQEQELIAIDEHSGRTNKWSFKPTSGKDA